MTFETLDQSDEETWPDQQKDNDKDNSTDKDKCKDQSENALKEWPLQIVPLVKIVDHWYLIIFYIFCIISILGN